MLFNLDEFSNFKNLRIIAYRNKEGIINCDEKELSNTVIEEVNKINKEVNVNLIILRLDETIKLEQELEKLFNRFK